MNYEEYYNNIFQRKNFLTKDDFNMSFKRQKRPYLIHVLLKSFFLFWKRFI